jgi:hypothetical protein
VFVCFGCLFVCLVVGCLLFVVSLFVCLFGCLFCLVVWLLVLVVVCLFLLLCDGFPSASLNTYPTIMFTCALAFHLAGPYGTSDVDVGWRCGLGCHHGKRWFATSVHRLR